jgi:hypothetical protein
MHSNESTGKITPMPRFKMPLVLALCLSFAGMSVIPHEIPSASALRVLVIIKHKKPHKKPHKKRHKHKTHTIRTVILRPKLKVETIKPAVRCRHHRRGHEAGAFDHARGER